MSEVNKSNKIEERWLSELKQYLLQTGIEFTSIERSQGITYRYLNKRIFKLIHNKTPTLELNIFPLEEIPGFQTITLEDAKSKHMGSMVGRYKGDFAGALKLLTSICHQLENRQNTAETKHPLPTEKFNTLHPKLNSAFQVGQSKYQMAFESLLKSFSLLPISNWNRFELKHGQPISESHFEACCKTIVQSVGNRRGLYIYSLQDGQILYVGKAKLLKDRLKSHLIESFRPVTGDTKHQNWHGVFRSYPETLSIYWFEIEAEKDRQILEKMLQQFLNPVFEQFCTVQRRLVKSQKLD